MVARFVPVADEVGRLQREKDPECLLFQSVAEQGHYAGRTRPSNTRQGIYALAPDGTFLGSINTTHSPAIARMLRDALERWDALEARSRAPLPADAPVVRWERLYPEDGLVLRVHARDLGKEAGGDDWREHAWNLDFAWFRRGEAREFVPDRLEPGASVEVPAEVVRRFVRCHLRDQVRGQTPAFRREAVELARLVSEVVRWEGRVVDLRLSGASRCRTTGRWPVEGFADRESQAAQELGVETRMLGRARFDLAVGRFVSFDLVAVGTRWGGTQFNGRGGDLAPSPIGFAATLAGDGPEERIAPGCVWEYGWR